MISRHWTGLAKKERANEYIAHLQNDTFKQLKNIDGFISANILRREIEEGIEFLIITEWKSLRRSFTGNSRSRRRENLAGGSDARAHGGMNGSPMACRVRVLSSEEECVFDRPDQI